MNSPANAADAGYSPPITIELIVDGQHFDVASLGPDNLILRDACKIPNGKGVVRLTIDGNLTVYHVDLIEGIDPLRTRQPFLLIGTNSEAAA